MEKAVLVTGASSGIGRKIVERLAASDTFIYGTVRREEDLKPLAGMRNVKGIILDVTKPLEITKAAQQIADERRTLVGLVNNAGVATIDTIADMSMEEFDLVMAVNVYGPVRMIKTFLPQILENKGRIVNIGSISGILAGPTLGAYSMSKHAIEALTDSLAEQLATSGVRVSVVEPGNFNSRIIINAVGRERLGSKVDRDQSIFPEPDEVAAAVEHALFDQSPRRRYLVVSAKDQAISTIRKQVEQLVQLNEGHAHALDRSELMRILDELMTSSRS